MRYMQSLSVVLALIAGQASAQQVLNDVQKAASTPPEGTLSDTELGLPANPDAAKVATLVVRYSAAQLTDYDSDKIVGNDPVDPPLMERGKLPGTLPEGTPAADLGQPPVDIPKTADLTISHAADAVPNIEDYDKIAGNAVMLPERVKVPSILPESGVTPDFGQPATDAPKTADLTISHAADAVPNVEDNDKIAGNPVLLADRTKLPQPAPEGATAADLGQPPEGTPKADEITVSFRDDARLTNYDEDKITGNEPQPAPLTERVKMPSELAEPLDPVELGQPVTGGVYPKTADLAASFAADAVPSIYDEDKIAGNEPPPEPLGERQKFPGTVLDGVDAATLGTPASDAPKTADLGVSRAADSRPQVDDNDKIVGNPYVQPPMSPRTKLVSILPDPVVDADLGQPAATDGPKAAAVTVSLAADAVPNMDDNDKIAGNPVISPPLSDRAKLASDTDVTALTPEDLGLPADSDAAKATVLDVSRADEAVTTAYDEDKIADNNSFDGMETYSDGMDDFDLGPPPELVAQIRAMLDDAALRDDALAQARDRVTAPEPVIEPFVGFLTALFDQTAVRDALAVEVARPFDDFGMSPDNPEIVARMTAEQLVGWGAEEALFGMARLPVAEQRGFLADTLRVADTLEPAECAAYLDDVMDGAQIRQTEITAMAAWSAAEIETALIRNAAAIVAEVQDNPALRDLSPTDFDAAQKMAGERMIAAIEAAENAEALLLAYGNPDGADPADVCAVHKSNLRVVLDTEGPDGDLLVRYLVSFGWVN
jgi:hypothetical protein